MTHTYIHLTYIHTYIPSTHIYIHTYIHTYLAHIHTYIHTYVHTEHTYIHIVDTYTLIHEYIVKFPKIYMF